MALRDCTGQIGRVLCIETPPSQRAVQDALFVPLGVGPQWGLFEPSGRSVPEAVTYHGVHNEAGHFHAPDCALWLNTPLDGPTLSDEFDYFYIGPIEGNHSFFYTRSLARFWALPSFSRHRLRLVYSTSDRDALFRAPYFPAICKAFELAPSNFLRVDSPVRFSRITVPAPSFEELSLIHKVHVDLLHTLGNRLVPSGVTPLPGRVVYVSKEHLPTGNVRVGNEAVLTQALQARGIGIVFPEKMSLREQMELWAANPLVVGFDTSFLYTSAFFPRRRIVTLAHEEQIWTNQCLFDKANGNEAYYLYDDEGLEPIGPGGGFNMTFQIKDPQRLANEIADFTLAR